MDKLQLDDWISSYRRRKWRWAGHVLRREDRRWTATMLHWTPEMPSIILGRKRGRPHKRWEQDFEDFFATLQETEPDIWKLIALNREECSKLETQFFRHERW